MVRVRMFDCGRGSDLLCWDIHWRVLRVWDSVLGVCGDIVAVWIPGDSVSNFRSKLGIDT